MGLEGIDTVEQKLERLDLIAEEHSKDIDEWQAGRTLAESIRITDIDPLSVDLPRAITELDQQLREHGIAVPRLAQSIVDRIKQWATRADLKSVSQVMNQLSALLLAGGLDHLESAALADLKHSEDGKWTDGRFTLTVAAVFRPVLVDLVARWTLPEAPAAVFHYLGSSISADQLHISVAYAAGCLLPTAPQIRSLVMAYFRAQVPVCIVEQAVQSDDEDKALFVMLVACRLLYQLPETAMAWGWEAPLTSLMGPQHSAQVRYLACECLCRVKSLSDQGRTRLLATLSIDNSLLTRTRTWLVYGQQQFVEQATRQLAEQNRRNFEQGIWQPMPAEHRWLEESLLSASVACVGGVLLHAHAAERRDIGNDFVVTPMVARNAHAVALATSRGEPVLLQGAAGSGKTALVEWAAQRTGNELVTIHVSGNMDAKVLLGSYVTSQRAGDFEWRSGLLATAVEEGHWVLIENIDLAPPDVVQTLLPLLETRALFVATRGQRIAAHEQFRLFATLSPDSRAVARAEALLGSSIWTRVEIGALDAEMPAIIRGAFPRLSEDAEALATAFTSIRDIAGSAAGSSREPTLSTRDLVKWCARLSVFYGGDRFLLFQEAVDVFTLRESDFTRWRTLAQRVGSVLGISKDRVQQFMDQYSPNTTTTGRVLKIGRASLSIDGAAKSEQMPFADTRHARRLLERIATCVQLQEPTLLMGETGTGKTTVVQHLAALTGRPLMVFNLSQQSDAADLLGGFRPVDVGQIALRLRETFDALFARTVSVRKNAAFLDKTRSAFGRRDWKRLAALYRAALGNARQMLEKARKQLPAASAEQGEQSVKTKRPRLMTEAGVEGLSEEWDAFERSLEEFSAMRGAKMAFAFVEGALVKAARAGAWILLDEVNLAAPETLACLGGLLQRERTLLLAETGTRIACHRDFRLFACMNPATDVGKRDLPPALRSSFTEIYVHPPDADADDLLAIVRAHLPANAPPILARRIIEFYRSAKTLASEHRVVDGAGQRPHYSLRTLTRSLTYTRDHATAYSLRRALYDGLCMTFATQLEGSTQAVLLSELQKVFAGDNVAQMLRVTPPARPDAVLVQGFWLPALPEATSAAAAAGDEYVITASVEAKITALGRAVMCGRYPVLIQGPTSAGKTSMVQHLARVTGHTFVRINNHEHTDLQEYLGAYASVDGQLVFQEGLLVTALRHGHWLVLDELNLAPSDVLEALNRLLDDNRELVIPETQEVVRPHPHFMLFATQNPAGLYGGRKALSRAFRNRFVELHFDDIPEAELQQIIVDSCCVPPTHARLLVDVYRNLTHERAQTRIFEASHGFITLRDLFRWAKRRAVSRDELAEHGFMLLAERTRSADEKRVVQRAIERAFYTSSDQPHSVRVRRKLDVAALYSEERLRAMPEFAALQNRSDIAWTAAMRRLFILTALCVRFNEPVLLVGDTGSGKTTVCQMLAAARSQQLRIVNCHQNTESSDILGSQRPVRNRAALLAAAYELLLPVLGEGCSSIDTPAALQQHVEHLVAQDPDAQQRVVDANKQQLEAAYEHLARAQALFAWHDGPLVQALRHGDMFLMDELNLADDSVLERLNSVLEPSRTLVLAENVGAAVVTAQEGFQFVATMNPGGDYGKRELSPALRNRFTELWAPQTEDRDDLLLIICQRLRGVDNAQECARVMLDFVAYLRDQLRVLQHPLSLRDYLFWAEFIQRSASLMDTRRGVVHGACMVLLDSIGTQGSPFSVSALRSPASVKAECVAQLRSMVGDMPHALADLGVVPARDLNLSAAELAALVKCDQQSARVGVEPFMVETGAVDGSAGSFALHAPTTFDNLVKILRAMQVGKPLLMEGSPGVGKTTLVSTLARVAGHRLVRINLSDQTDLMDLFGTDLPVDDGFAWCDAPFLQALKQGDWVLLDEINLASQSVLEGLNSCLDHRGTVYISELDREFTLSRGFRLFAAQNPLGQGGGRKGLPRSFVNRFTQVFMDELQRDDLRVICNGMYQAHSSIDQVLEFNWRMHQATMGHRRVFGSTGAPWEFNLRDVSRFMELALSPSLLEPGSVKPVDEFVPLLYVHRMRTQADRQQVLDLFHSVFGRSLQMQAPSVHVTESTLQVGNAMLLRHPEHVQLSRLQLLAGQLPYLESLAKCIEMRWMPILVGSAGAGKTSLVRWLARATGNKLVEFAMNAGVDTSEILGGFEQVDMQRHRSRLLQSMQTLVDRVVAQTNFGNVEQAQITSQACSMLLQAQRSNHDTQSLQQAAEHIVSTARSCDSALSALAEAVQEQLNAFLALQVAGRFEWVDGVLVEALERGYWLLLDRANLCSASVLDRLNGLLEPNGVLYVNEDPKRTGPVVPHPDFRIIMAVDPQHGELSRAMRNRGIEICMLPSEGLGAQSDQMSLARSLGVDAMLLEGMQQTDPSLTLLVQTAADIAERVQRGYPAWPDPIDTALSTSCWQARLLGLASHLQVAFEPGIDMRLWRERMLLAALSTVPPDSRAVSTSALQAISGDMRDVVSKLLEPTQLTEALVVARHALAQSDRLNLDVLQSAPLLVQLNVGLYRALQRTSFEWHNMLQQTRLFQMERQLQAHFHALMPSEGDVRELVLQQPNVDVAHAQSMFALLEGCEQLLSMWDDAISTSDSFQQMQEASDIGSAVCVASLRTIYAMYERLNQLLQNVHAVSTASEQAVALETMQNALQKVGKCEGAVGAHARKLIEVTGRLVQDATHSVRLWAITHPTTMPDARMRDLAEQLETALKHQPGHDKGAEAVEALAMLYAAASRKNKDLIVNAVEQFVTNMPTLEQPAEVANTSSISPAQVLADIEELRQWRQILQLTLISGCVSGQIKQRALSDLRLLTENAGVSQASPWAVMLTRLRWQANDSSETSRMLPLFTEAASQWHMQLASHSLDEAVDMPRHRLSSAVATELAWRGATRLCSSLNDLDLAIQDGRDLVQAVVRFSPTDIPVASMAAGLVAQLALVGDVLSDHKQMPCTEHLLAALCSSDDMQFVDMELVSAWHAELVQHASSDSVTIAADSVQAALRNPADKASMWVAMVEVALSVLAVSVPQRPVDPAAKALAQWTWLGDTITTCRADISALKCVQHSMTGTSTSSAIESVLAEMQQLEQQRASIELVYRPTDAVRFSELWQEAHNLVQSMSGRIRQVAKQLAGSHDDSVLGASSALDGALTQFVGRVRQRYFTAYRDQAQLWTLCAQQAAYGLSNLAQMQRMAAQAQSQIYSQLLAWIYTQPIRGIPLTKESVMQMGHALSQLKTLAFASARSPLAVYGRLLRTLLARVVMSVQVRGVLNTADIEALGTLLRDASDVHRRSTAEQKRRETEAASLFRFKATEEPSDEKLQQELFPGFEDVFEDQEDVPEPSFDDVPDEAIAALSSMHQYALLQFGAISAVPDIQSSLALDVQRQALSLAADLYRARPEVASLLTAEADSELRGANAVAAALGTLQDSTLDAVPGVRATQVYDFYQDACVEEARLVRPIAQAIAARTQQLLEEWPEHAVLQQICDMCTRLLQLPATSPVAKLLAAVELLYQRAQDWQAYASRDVSITELQDVSRLIVRWRQRELNSWPHLLLAQELAFARRPRQWWLGLYAALVVPESVELSELVAAVDHFMQGSPAGEFRGRLNMLLAFAAHRAALLKAQVCETGKGSLEEAKRRDTVYGPLLNAVGYYLQFAPCIAAQLEATKKAVSKDLKQYVKISSWKDVNPAALRASAQKTHRHLTKCVRRWRDALSQPIFQIIQVAQQGAVATARVPQVLLVPLPLSDAGLEINPPSSLPKHSSSSLPWAAKSAVTVDDAEAQRLAQLVAAESARVLANSSSSLAQLARLMEASPVFGQITTAQQPGVLEAFGLSIVSDISHFQSVEAPSHLIKSSSNTTVDTEAPAAKKNKRIIGGSRKQQESADKKLDFVEDDEERQRLLLRFWGDQRNLRRTRLKEILRGLQDIGLRRHFRAPADAPTGLTAVLSLPPLEVSAWRESVQVLGAMAPESLHSDVVLAHSHWQLANSAFFQFSAQLAQLRSAAFAEHSSEVDPQQVQRILSLSESLNDYVSRDRKQASELLATAVSWMQAAAPWGAMQGEQQQPQGVSVSALKHAVDGLRVLLMQFDTSARAVNDAGGWAGQTGDVMRVLNELSVATEQISQAQSQLAVLYSAASASQLAGSNEQDAAPMLDCSRSALDAVELTKQAVSSVARVIEVPDQATSPLHRLLEPWTKPISDAIVQVQDVLQGKSAGDSENETDVAAAAAQWSTAVLNVWQAIHKAEKQYSEAADGTDLNAWGMAPKELVRRVHLMQQFVRALHLPTMLPLCQRLTRLCRGSSATSRVVRPWITQYSLIVQHVVAAFAQAHKTLVQFALTTTTALTSVVIHGLGTNEIFDSEETNESMQSGMGVGEGSTAGAKNVSDEIEGEDQIEGVQGEEPDSAPNEPGTNEDAVDMENDFEGAMGDADLETDEEDSDEESDEEDEEQDLDEQLGDVDPTDPTALDDKMWDDEQKESKNEDSSLDSKAQKQKDDADIVAGDEDSPQQEPNDDHDEQQQQQQDSDAGSGDEASDEEEEGDLDDQINQDTLDRMADVEDQGEQLEMPEDLDMGDEEGSEEEDDGLEADMNELPEDEPIEQKPEAMDEDNAEAAENDGQEEDAVKGSEEQADGDEEMADSGDEEAEGSIDGETKSEDEAAGESEGESEGEDAAEDGDEPDDAAALGEDAPEDERQNSGQKPTHGVDSAMNLDGTDDADPNTAAESNDALPKPSEASAADNQQVPAQSSKEQQQQDASFMQAQDSEEQQQQQAERKLNPERTLADVIEKWERRLNIVMRDEEEEEKEEAEAAQDPEQQDGDPAAPEASEFEHIKPEEAFDKVALADASEQERDQQEFQPMDLDDQDASADDPAQDHNEAAAEMDSEAPVKPPPPAAGANPQPRQTAAPRENASDAAQMQQASAKEEEDSSDVEMEAGEDHAAEAQHEDEPDETAETAETVDVEQLREELEQATAEWREQQQESGRALELWQQYTRLTHDLSLMLTEQLRLILTPTQATQLRGDYRTGKRLNMKRIIPYIASEFRKDKIWLRRTKPARREYQVMVALDNSKSMAQSPQAVELAYETLALVTTALGHLEVGQLSVVSFGESVSLLHPFDAPFDADAGARVLSRFTFADDKTDAVQLMDASLQLFEAAPASADLWRLQLVISDGVCQDHARLLRQVRAAMEQRVMIVFIVLDRSAIATSGADIDPEKDSIMNTQHVSFVRGPSGKMEMKVERYLDTFPFKYYVILRDIHGLPAVLAETLRQYFSLDPITRSQIECLVAGGDDQQLELLLRHPIEFGTAGLRARMEAGYARLNQLTVISASQGLSAYVEHNVPNAHERGVVVGHDHRHNSAVFAQLTVRAFLDRGFRVYFYPQIGLTPQVPFAVKRLKAACGVMITASHNPKDDNGYKVYWENGAQIKPPIDEGIAASIAEHRRPLSWDVEGIAGHERVVDVTADMMDAYFEAASQQLLQDRELNSRTQLRYVYTAMHGVGAPFAARMLRAFGLPPFIGVPEQLEPDPDFPTVPFPNPEEKGALDLAKRLADSRGVGLVVANDPDADRFAAAEKQADGSWLMFTGDQLGAIFAAYVLEMARGSGVPDAKLAMVNSTVSSRMLKSMAQKEGFHYTDTLTGFKWMANELAQLQARGYFVGLGYEEAIGYMIHDHVLDKDGVTALAVFVQLAARLHAEGRRVGDYLESLYAKYGFYISANSYFICPDPAKMDRIFSRIRYGDSTDTSGRTEYLRPYNSEVLRYPRTIGGFPVSYIRDLTIGFEMNNVDQRAQPLTLSENEYQPKFPVSPSSHMITFETRNGGRLTMRTSGTEPKLKYYLEVCNREGDREAAARDLDIMAQAVAKELVQSAQNHI
ncbi:AAA ATPase midasin [Coemansia sp. RSA 2336]|nr:AAA ATPase midasin [Coemansia sp. RSA 2336]